MIGNLENGSKMGFAGVISVRTRALDPNGFRQRA